MFVLPKISPDFIKKNQLTFALIIAFSLVGFFVSSYVKSNDSSRADLLDQIKYYKIELTLKDSQVINLNNQIYNLQQQILISNGILDKLPEKVESLTVKRKRK